MKIYQENFTKWKDVQEAYQMQMAKPDKVYLAYYSYEDYSGSSYVVYRKDDKYYLNEGSHCSCYGLEDQWDPTEYNSKEELLGYLEKTRYYSHEDLIKNLIKKLKRETTV